MTFPAGTATASALYRVVMNAPFVMVPRAKCVMPAPVTRNRLTSPMQMPSKSKDPTELIVVANPLLPVKSMMPVQSRMALLPAVPKLMVTGW